MQKFLILTALCLILLTGCARTLDDIIASEPSIAGTVIEVSENSILIEDEDSLPYTVSLDAECRDSMTDFTVGDEVVVYFDGIAAESYPMQISRVYAITLKTPAERK